MSDTQTTQNDDPMALLLGMLGPEIAAQIGAMTGGAQQGPPVYMGESQTPVTRVRIGNVDRNEQAGSVQRGGEMVSDVRTIDEAVSEFYAWDDEELRDFQERAFNAGLYGTRDRNRVRFGDPTDAQTFNIWADMVQAASGFYTHGRKVTPWDAVDLAVRGATEDVEPEEAPLSVSLTNPEDIKRLVNQVASEAIGQGLSPERADEIVAEWQARERQYQTQAHAMRKEGGTITGPPSLQTFADQKAKETDPVAYDSYKVLDKFSQVLETFGGQ